MTAENPFFTPEELEEDEAGPAEAPRRREGAAPKARGRPAERPARPVSAEWLSRAAAYYLERYSSSAETLRRVLWRKVQRRAAARGEDAEGFRHLVEATVARFVELQLVDDRRFAEGWLAGQSRRGTSRRMASLRLSQKGVDRDLVEDLMPAGEAADEAERASAHAYARRRRLGPHRLREREERRDRDIAAMMRAGFSFQDSRAAIDGDGGPGSLPG